MAYVPLSRLDQIDNKVTSYPEFSMFGEMPSWGFYVRYVDGITMNNVTLRLKDSDFRPAYIFDDVNNIKLNSTAVPKEGEKRQIILKNVDGYKIDASDQIGIIK